MQPSVYFVTGSTGLLGSTLIKLLLEKGAYVRALAHSREKAEIQFADLERLEIIDGDIDDISSFSQALEGCDAVFHTTTFFRDKFAEGIENEKEMAEMNIEGTQALLEAVYDAGIRDFIYTSSVAVLDGPRGTLIDESCDRSLETTDEYYRAEILSEQTVRRFTGEEKDMRNYFILPGWIWGPGDMTPTAAGQLVLDVLHSNLPASIPGSFSVVDVRDVAAAMVAVLTSGRPGERYLVGGTHVLTKDLITLIGETANVATPSFVLPVPILYGAAFAQDVFNKITGKNVGTSLAAARVVIKEANRTHFSSQKCETELKVITRPLEETIKDTVQWYYDNGYAE